MENTYKAFLVKKEFMQVKVFLDTNALLKGFGASRSQQVLPVYLTDPSAERYTFEKCVLRCTGCSVELSEKNHPRGEGDGQKKT